MAIELIQYKALTIVRTAVIFLSALVTERMPHFRDISMDITEILNLKLAIDFFK